MRRLQIVESTEQIKARILFEVRSEVDKRLRRYSSVISRKIGALVGNAIMSSEHVKSLLTGQLKADFGLSDQMAEQALKELIQEIRSTITVKLEISSGMAFSLRVSFLKTGISQLLSNIGEYDSNGNSIQWMRWLLLNGSEVIIDDFFVYNDTSKETSRSKMAIMVPSGSSNKVFRVDPIFAGTEEDNFVIDAINSIMLGSLEVIKEYLL